MKTVMTKTVMTKTLLAATLAAAMGVGSTSAMAIVFNPFEVTEVSVPGASPNPALLSPNSAGKITGNYTEIGTFTPTSATAGTFDSSILWNAGQYVAPNGSTVLVSQLGGFTTNQYDLYAFFMGSGTYSTDIFGVTIFNMSPAGSVNVWIDPSSDTTYTAPLLGSGAWTTSGGAGDDYLIATGTPISGDGTLDPTLLSCDPGINCGSYGTTTSFALTALGSSYFTSPVPFYNLSFESGQFNNFSPTATQIINGSADVVFGNSVPEPESLALLGIGLLGLGLARRGRKQA